MYYENNWQSLNSRPVPAWFGKAKFGIFIHWGLYSVPAYTARGQYAEWYMQQLRDEHHPARAFHDRVYGKGFRYEDFVSRFTAELFDAAQWAELFRKSGAKYINFVSKHHDGFCLYKSKYAYNWNSVDVGPHRDFLAELREAMEGTGVRFGVYHSVYEWFHPLYLENPETYATEHLIPMLRELVENYRPYTLFTDGEWEHPSATWHATEFLQWLFNESSVRDTIVVNDRWGKETRGRLGGNYTTEYGEVGGGVQIEDHTRPFEECRGIGKSFGLNRVEGVDDYMTAKELLTTLCDLVSKGGNFLLNIGPAADGTIPVIMEERLRQMGDWLAVNGEAIYDSEVYDREGEPGVWYTKRDGHLYAILDRFPFGRRVLDKVPYSEKRTARLLNNEEIPIPVREKNGRTELCFPPIDPSAVQTKELYVIRLDLDKETNT